MGIPCARPCARMHNIFFFVCRQEFIGIVFGTRYNNCTHVLYTRNRCAVKLSLSASLPFDPFFSWPFVQRWILTNSIYWSRFSTRNDTSFVHFLLPLCVRNFASKPSPTSTVRKKQQNDERRQKYWINKKKKKRRTIKIQAIFQRFVDWN